MTDNQGSNPILEAARKLQEQKLAAVQGVVDTRAVIAGLREQLADAERKDATAYAAAVRAGWSEAELKQVGVDAPARQAPGRPRSRRQAQVPPDAERAMAQNLARSTIEREARASVALDRDQTHVVGDPVGAGAS